MGSAEYQRTSQAATGKQAEATQLEHSEFRKIMLENPNTSRKPATPFDCLVNSL